MTALSLFAVFCVALLSRAELRLSGELLAAGNPQELSTLSKLGSFEEVKLVRETPDLRLYILSGEKDYIAEVRKIDEIWEVVKVEQLHD